ncbi:unnamed protein product [Effrenium voratum]|nr:unnamed protein product [Effrenium voratum]
MAGTSAPGPQLPRPTKGITKAIISAASRPTALDSRHRPKPLIDIEGTTLISHVLRQLYRGGITHIVFVVSHNGAAIIEELERCRGNLRNLELEVVDLGKDYAGFYAVSLLKAWECCATDLVLIATADHIFDESLVADICRVPLCPRELCVLVDFSRETWTGLPATTVGVQCSEDLHKAFRGSLAWEWRLGCLPAPAQFSRGSPLWQSPASISPSQMPSRSWLAKAWCPACPPGAGIGWLLRPLPSCRSPDPGCRAGRTLRVTRRPWRIRCRPSSSRRAPCPPDRACVEQAATACMCAACSRWPGEVEPLA